MSFLPLKAPVLIASDHGGFELKSFIQKELAGLNFNDLGPETNESVDYPDLAQLLTAKLKEKPDSSLEDNPDVMGILVCGSGQGMAITANKTPGVRAALCWSTESASLARAHNNANVLCLGARLLSEEQALDIVKTFLSTSFEAGRHSRRINKIES